jgi:hypothetical protein
MAKITRLKADLLVSGSLANGLGGSVNQVPIGPGGGKGYIWAEVALIVAASTDPNPYIYNNGADDAFIEVDASSQNVQIVLPNAAVSQGQYRMVKRSDATFASGNVVTVIDAAGNNVEGSSAGQTLNAQNSIMELRCDGTSWQIIGGQNSAAWGHVTPIAAIAVGASPFTYTATAAGTVFVSGGTDSALQLKRGATTIATGFTDGPVPVSAGDQVIVTYSAAPTMNFVAR